MQYNLALPRQMTGQNQAKCLEMFIYILKIVVCAAQANESNFEKISLWWISHVNEITMIYSVETLVAK